MTYKTFKTFAALFFFVILFALSNHAAQASVIQKQPNNLGLVGYWSLNEGVGTQAGDSSGNGNGGPIVQVSGSPSWTTGKRGSALSFDGSNNGYVEIADIGPMANFTLSAWIYNQSGGDGRHSVLNNFWEVVGNDICYWSYNFANLYWRCSGGGVPYDTWTHVVTTWDGSVIRHYINGSLYWTDSSPSSGTNQTFATIAGYSDRRFKGKLDDIRIYNRALSAAEVSYLYGSGSAKMVQGSSPKLVRGLQVWVDAADNDQVKANSDCTGAVVNGGTVGCVLDKSGQGNNFTQATAGFRPTYVTNVKKGNPVFRMLGASSQTLTTSTNFLAPVTVLYVGHQTGGYNGRVLTATNNNWLLGYWSGGKRQAYFEGWVSSVGSPTTDTSWNLYSAVISGSGSNSNVYENGNLLYSNQGGVSGPNGLTLEGNGENSNAETGEVLVYNRALSDSERRSLERYLANKWGISVVDQNGNTPSSGKVNLNASQNSRLTSGLVGYWSFNGSDISGTTAYDRSGQGNSGTINGSIISTIGKVGQGMSFDGASYITASPISLSRFSVSVWVKPNGNQTGAAGVVSDMYPSYVNYTIAFDSGSLNVFGGTYNAGWYQTPRATLLDQTWSLVTTTFDGTNIYLYINGALIGSSPAAITPQSSGTQLRIGRRWDAADYFKGSLDEVRVYNRALSAAEVSALYNMGK